MTLDIAKLQELYRQGLLGEFDNATYNACVPTAHGGGGLLERHAILLKLAQAADAIDRGITERDTCLDCDEVSACEDHGDAEITQWGAFRNALKELRASDALPPGKGETP